MQIPNFMKILPVVAELFHADRQTDLMKPLVIFRTRQHCDNNFFGGEGVEFM